MELALQENMASPMVVGHGSWHMTGEICGFVHYNIKYVVFIVTYFTLIL
jgi:hypothetical protein